MSYMEERLHQKQFGKPPKEKNYKGIRPISEKRQAQLDAEKELRKGDPDTLQEKFYKKIRPKLVGVCQCGCGKPSQKKDDLYFRHSICHIFPKSKFESIRYHLLNYVERTFWGGHHTNMDEQSITKWPNMADWDDIREKFFILAPLLTDAERATKFYANLEKLVYLEK